MNNGESVILNKKNPICALCTQEIQYHLIKSELPENIGNYWFFLMTLSIMQLKIFTKAIRLDLYKQM